jgi:hypothetical protein
LNLCCDVINGGKIICVTVTVGRPVVKFINILPAAFSYAENIQTQSLRK